MIELLVVMAIIGLVAASVVPWMIPYWRAATLKAGAEELAAGFNRGRQLAITQNRSVCVEIGTTRYRYVIDGCAGTPWLGPGSDVNGYYPLTNGVQVTTNANPVFDFLGAASPAATATVVAPNMSTNLRVVVSVAGRVRVCPASGCT